MYKNCCVNFFILTFLCVCECMCDQYPSYINVNSNHPKTIIKQVRKAVKLRIRNLFTNKKIF